MFLSNSSPTCARFHHFQVDLSSGVLERSGVRVPVQAQPLQVLRLLLQADGKVVTREELRKVLWPEDTFVDFELGVNTAVKKLRQALADPADRPKFIETLPKIGYRFLVPVEWVTEDGQEGITPKVEGSAPSNGIKVASVPENHGRAAHVVDLERRSAVTKKWVWLGVGVARLTSTKRLALLFSFLGFLVVTAVILWLNLRSPLAIPRVVDSLQITNDGLPKGLTLKLVNDGTRLYFREGSLLSPLSLGWDIEFQGGGLVQVSGQGGDTARIPVSFEDPVVYDISPTRSELLLGGHESKSPTLERVLWAAPLPVGSPHRVGDIVAEDACWAPDGRHLAFAHNNDLFAAKSDGTEVRKLTTVNGSPYWIRFSPDGTRLRFTVLTRDTHPEDFYIMEIRADGRELHRLPIHGCCGTWSADGQYYFYQENRDIWVLPERRSIIRGIELGTPVQLTAGPITFGASTPSVDGKRLFVTGNQPRIELVHYESKSNQLVPFLGGISAGELEVSPDGQWVAYTTYPDSTLWRSKLDGTERLQLTFAPVNAHEPRWSPDGKQILFTDVPRKIFVVPANGGTPQQLMPGDHPTVIGAGSWLPDGNSIVFVMRSDKYAIYRLNLKTQQISKIPGSDRMFGARLSREGRYLTATTAGINPKVMLYDFQTEKWSELVQGGGAIAWSHDSKFVYLQLIQGTQPADLVRISVPGGKIERVLDLKDITLGGFWSDWISLLPDDSPLLMLERSKQEIYRLELQYR